MIDKEQENCPKCGYPLYTGEHGPHPVEETAAAVPPDVRASIDAALRNFTRGNNPPESPPIPFKELEDKFADDPALFAGVREYLSKTNNPAAPGMLESFEKTVTRILHASVREFLSQAIEEEDEDIKEKAGKFIQKILEQGEGARAEALRDLREQIKEYRKYDRDFDRIPEEYNGLYGADFDSLLKMIPENAAILKEAAEILQMPADDARQKLEDWE